jgi:NAD(P)-dependent dehydrogenase (short-subunit alcohol dehydrogenase family)
MPPRSRTALLVPARSEVTAVVADLLHDSGWAVTEAADGPVDALVFDPGLLRGDPDPDPAATLQALVERTPFPARDDGGAAVVVIGSRDQLGRVADPHRAALAGAVFAAARSIALALAPSGVTVNVVAGVPTDGRRGLLPDAPTLADVAGAVAFLADPRSRYITGQLLFCDAGDALLSSMSV